MIQNTESHYRARLTVLHTIYEIANIMQISCYLYKLDRSLRIAESLQYVSCLFSYQRYMGKAVLGKSECRQRQICLTDIGIDLLILLDLLICHDVFRQHSTNSVQCCLKYYSYDCLGKFITTVVPSFSLLSSEICALWYITPCFTIESPSPVPPIDCDLALSTR